MASTFTPSLQLEVPARGDYVNTWDLPMDASLNSIDAAVGQQATVTCTGGDIYLTQAQANCQIIYLVGSLTSAQYIAFPPTSAGRKIVIPNCAMNGFGVYIRGNNFNDPTGVYFINQFGIPYPVIVTPGRVYWDYGGCPPGTVASFPVSFLHPGWLCCDGGWYDTTLHDLLFDLMGYAYGGSGTGFAVPDYRGYSLVGSDNMGGPAGNAGRFFNFGPNGITGEVNHTLQLAEMPYHSHGDYGHNHGLSDPGHAHGGVLNQVGAGGWYSLGSYPPEIAGGSTAGSGTGITIGVGYANLAPSGSSGAHNNVQPSRTVNKYIRW